MKDTGNRIEIGRAKPEDLPGIIGLIKLSLGEESTEKSAEFWKWKHEDNPFGASPVLLARDGAKLVGVRAFMRWEWTDGRRTYRALRAVDTATHPEYRGRGIFKRLTLRLIEECKAAGDDFIFNTPNFQSRPGYLKMGWEELGRLPLRMAPLRPLEAVSAKWLGRLPEPIVIEPSPAEKLLREPEKFSWLGASPSPALWHTPVSPAFLRWRYLDCPVRDYHVIGQEEDYLAFYYVRQQDFGNELRLVHCLAKPGGEKKLGRAIAQLGRRLRPTVMTAAPSAGLPFNFLPPLRLGLILTFRPLNYPTPPSITEWGYTLGDMELF